MAFSMTPGQRRRPQRVFFAYSSSVWSGERSPIAWARCQMASRVTSVRQGCRPVKV